MRGLTSAGAGSPLQRPTETGRRALNGGAAAPTPRAATDAVRGTDRQIWRRAQRAGGWSQDRLLTDTFRTHESTGYLS